MNGSRRRFTVKQMMIGVALLAVLLAAMFEGPRLWILRRQYLGLAEGYGYWETRFHGAVSIRQEITYYSMSLPRGPEPSPARIQDMKTRAAYYARLRAKYERAARYPWMAVEPDPPPPTDLETHSR